ncbi:hypothetical protein F4553_005884 [Allocatelliglobosispora scoriae]|uniref:DUF3806 domain-containing protein n=1 Tax=Allocatelliglobosispora scoriae TaxID=643052 RepID=A0A841C0H3_9ACTN|nr:hypothetical protein [Allocatelliglobosispora scoriae]MBB5872450.1 hypothetical protein [Allocatelliglobosispora scoriae]
MPTQTEVAGTMQLMAEAFIRASADEGAKLGWEADDASRLDGICDAFLRSNPPEDVQNSMVMAMGAYLGELLVRTGGGQWTYDADQQEAAVIMPNGTHGYPHSKVAKRLYLGAEHDLLDFYERSLAPAA